MCSVSSSCAISPTIGALTPPNGFEHSTRCPRCCWSGSSSSPWRSHSRSLSGADLPPPFGVWRQALGEHQSAQVMQGADVDTPLEVHDLAHGRPVIRPPPPVELGLVGAIEPQLRLFGHELQKKPPLLLADATVANVLPRQTVPQPALRGAQNPHVLRLQADFFLQFPVQRIFHPFAPVDAALGKLPATAADAATQEQLSGSPGQDDADICAETVSVNVIGSGRCGHGPIVPQHPPLVATLSGP